MQVHVTTSQFNPTTEHLTRLSPWPCVELYYRPIRAAWDKAFTVRYIDALSCGYCSHCHSSCELQRHVTFRSQTLSISWSIKIWTFSRTWKATLGAWNMWSRHQGEFPNNGLPLRPPITISTYSMIPMPQGPQPTDGLFFSDFTTTVILPWMNGCAIRTQKALSLPPSLAASWSHENGVLNRIIDHASGQRVDREGIRRRDVYTDMVGGTWRYSVTYFTNVLGESKSKGKNGGGSLLQLTSSSLCGWRNAWAPLWEWWWAEFIVKCGKIRVIPWNIVL